MNFQHVKGNLSKTGAEDISLTHVIKVAIHEIYRKLHALMETSPHGEEVKTKRETCEKDVGDLVESLTGVADWSTDWAEYLNWIEKQFVSLNEMSCSLDQLQNITTPSSRLPYYDITHAVEILSTGTLRLPGCIREHFLPPNSIGALPRKQTFSRLHQIIRNRLISGKLLPQMRNFKIREGCVVFTVKDEFKLILTVMADDVNEPWHLLDVEILVMFSKIGICKPTVHPIQLSLLQQIVRAHLQGTVNPLKDVFYSLHYFCKSLQLDDLYLHLLRLENGILFEKIRVEKYICGQKIIISYWHQLAEKAKSKLGYRLQLESKETEHLLVVSHIPSFDAIHESISISQSLRADHISVERLILQTIHIRSFARLRYLKLHFELLLNGVDCDLEGTPAYLKVPIVKRSWRNDNLYITIDTYAGTLLCHLPNYSDCPIMNSIQAALNKNELGKLGFLILELIFWVTYQHYKVILRHLRVTVTKTLTFLNQPNHPLLVTKVPKIFLKLHRHPTVVLVVQLSENQYMPYELEYDIFIAFIKYQSNENKLTPEQPIGLANIENHQFETVNLYAHIESLMQLDSSLISDGLFRNIHDQIILQKCAKTKQSSRAYIIPEIAYVVSICDEQMPFFFLANEFSQQKIPNTGLKFDRRTGSIELNLLALALPTQLEQIELRNFDPLIPSVEKHIQEDLNKRLVSICVRSKWNEECYYWVVEIVFNSTPLSSVTQPDTDARQVIHFSYKQINNATQTVRDILKDFSRIVNLYAIVYDLAKILKKERYNVLTTVRISTYNYLNLIIGYGPKKQVTCKIYWCPDSKRFRLIFTSDNSSPNPHNIIHEKFESCLNLTCSLIYLLYILEETYDAFYYVSKLLNISPSQLKTGNAVASFVLKPESIFKIFLVYQQTFCIEICFITNEKITIQGYVDSKDKLIQGAVLPSIQGFEIFLSKYINDDNIISPERAVILKLQALLCKYIEDGDINSPESEYDTLQCYSPIWSSSSETSDTSSECNFGDDKTEETKIPPGSCITLSQNAFYTICSPSAYFEGYITGTGVSSLERFLGCEYLRLQMQDFVKKNNNDIITSLDSAEPSTLLFNMSNFQCKLKLNPLHMQSLNLKLTRLSNKPSIELTDDNMHTLEQFFDKRVAKPPYSRNSIIGFFGLIRYCTPKMLSHFAKIMRLDMDSKQQYTGCEYLIKLCMQVPPSDTLYLPVPVGSPGVQLINKSVIAFFLKINRIFCHGKCSNKIQTLVLPLSYNSITNETRLLTSSKQNASKVQIRIMQFINTFSLYEEIHQECSIFPAITGLLKNLHILDDDLITL